MIIGISDTIICEPKMIAGVASIIASGREMDILVSPSSTIADDMEMIVRETQLIETTVLSKGKRGGMEAAETRVSDVNQSACWVWFIVFPFMAAYRACGVPFLTR